MIGHKKVETGKQGFIIFIWNILFFIKRVFDKNKKKSRNYDSEMSFFV